MRTTLCMLSVLLLSFFGVSAQTFEGIIEFKKQTTFDTTYYVYYIKGDKIRVDEAKAKYEKSSGTFLIDLKAKKITGISHDRKLYFDQAVSTVPATVKGKPEVVKTKNTKKLFGYTCTEYLVKSKEENVQVAYWLVTGFNFFTPMVKLVNRKDKSAVFFQQITGTEGMFPFLSSETSMTGKEESTRFEVTKIEKVSIDNSKFEIPLGYKKSEN